MSAIFSEEVHSSAVTAALQLHFERTDRFSQPSVITCPHPDWLIRVFDLGLRGIAAGMFHIKLIYSEVVKVTVMILSSVFVLFGDGLHSFLLYSSIVVICGFLA